MAARMYTVHMDPRLSEWTLSRFQLTYWSAELAE